MFKAKVISFYLETLHCHVWLCSRFDGSRLCGKHWTVSRMTVNL